MSEAATARPNQPAAQAAARDGGQNRVTELKVSGHLMTLDAGVFCVLQGSGAPATNAGSGLPCVRISLPPGSNGHPQDVSISTLHNDGWLNSEDSAALVRVATGPSQILVTVYQAPGAAPEAAPRLQVMRLGADAVPEARPAPPRSGQVAIPVVAPADAEVVIHVQRTGDAANKLGDWAGTRGSRLWIEGFSLTPQHGIKPDDLEYQAVLGRGWLSPWIEGGKFCGSRGMSLPLLGLKVRLKGAVAKTHECSYSATFVDGSEVGPVPAGETCEAESLAALEAFQVVVSRRGAAPAAGAATGGGRGSRSRGGAAAEARPAEEKPPAAAPASPPKRPARRPR